MRDKKKLLGSVILLLKKRYRWELQTALSHESPWQLLVATILSAQSQDAQVNRATKPLFKRYPNVGDYVKMRPTALYKHINTIGLYRGKGKNILKTAKIITKRFGSRVPETMEGLITLPGVGRKTANVVLCDAYGISEGIAIDTHCITVANRLGLVRTRNPVKIENKLMGLAPKSEWSNINHMFIALGRDTCTARRKYCERCVLNRICPSSDANA
jgi:endonuclease-3